MKLPLVASARTPEALVPKVRDTVPARIAFYASTPGYVRAFEHHRLGDLAAEAQQLSKAQRWEENPPALIDDGVLHEFVTVGTYDEIGTKILQRYGDVVTDIEFPSPSRPARTRRPWPSWRGCCRRRAMPRRAPPSLAREPERPGYWPCPEYRPSRKAASASG